MTNDIEFFKDEDKEATICENEWDGARVHTSTELTGPVISIATANRLLRERTSEFAVNFDSTGMRTNAEPTHKFRIIGEIEPITQDTPESLLRELVKRHNGAPPMNLIDNEIYYRAKKLLEGK